MNDQNIFYEAGIAYSHSAVSLWIPTFYTLVHLPTGKEFHRRVWVAPRANVSKLLLHWNRDKNWKVMQ